MRIAAIVLAGLVAGAPLTANTAQADVPAGPVPAHVYPLQPPPGPAIDPDPLVAVQNFQGHIADLHDNWETLSPEERSRRLKALQQEAPMVEAETRNLPPGQQLQVEGMLLSAMFQLTDLLQRMR
ncbi:hypothetical protein [Mycobacterium shigaense]|uniref:hypothetical protein n=1 Tax=Mycobacterium shigaense TaxID=722731 RepID=UPI000E58B083|nr:hypothetical protein [Mycobacterium shigaense]MEA1122434.1 hypothetical protein [Mycobacterium shigaense]